SIAFPLLSTGNYGFPKKISMRIALDVFSKFLMEHEMQIFLTVFGEEAFKLSNTLFRSVQAYIDENYVSSKFEEEYGVDEAAYHVGSANLSPRMKARRKEQQQYAAEYLAEANDDEDLAVFGAPPIMADAAMAPAPLAGKESLADMMDKMDASFSDTLMALIDATGEKPSNIYHKACVSKQVFSKINSNSNYQPSKATAIGFCLALELSLEEAQELLARAGYTLSKSSLSDVIIMYCIENKIYNVVFVDEILYEYDLAQIGSK
ncbi:MAG: macro domain-containing protein, partial [Eubacteriales bacterium]